MVTNVARFRPGRFDRPGATPSRPRRRARPILYLLVFSAFLLIVGMTATGQAMLVTSDASASLTTAVVGSDAATVRSFVTLNVHPEDLESPRLPIDRKRVLDSGLRLLVDTGAIMQVALLRPDGTIIAASAPEVVGLAAPVTDGLRQARDSQTVQAAIVPAASSGAVGSIPVETVIAEYFPIISDGRVFAIAAVWRDATPILAALSQTRMYIVTVALVGGAISLVLLFFVFRAAQRALSRQTDQLLEATRRDALTGSLNHGALVEALTAEVEAARSRDSGGVSVALIDIDNLTLLNNTYGHGAGDEALLTVARVIQGRFGDAVWGRYGPDEFLVAVGTTGLATLEPDIEGIRAELADLALTFESSERLPLTISAGIATYPTDGGSVTTLLANASVTLDEAKASGGDMVRVADASRPADIDAGRFDMLEGLVLAIDTKDRYTRRHSEDVARYADFLAAQLELEPDFRRTLYRAGRLHDIGKIGIPEGILRKPGRLAIDEYEIVTQHVALGDLIVRDLPDNELVRAGVRHHHERWDGTGYLDGLAGDEIPFIARLLAVADAFSAMTTTRPYRKALSVDEALRRLEDAADSQLEARLVDAFVGGIRSHADPPLPGDRVTTPLWTPDGRRVSA